MATDTRFTKPYDSELIPSYEWMMLRPIVRLRTATLIPTQPVLMIERLLALLAGEDQEGPDKCLHVIGMNRAYYIHNGHHRWGLGLIRGEEFISSRLWHLIWSSNGRT